MVDHKVLNEVGCAGQNRTQFIAVVCDGVGGTSGGEQAAELLAKGFENFDVLTCSPLTVSRQIHRINRAILVEQKRNPAVFNMAAAAAGLVMAGGRYLFFNLGDTRVYKYHLGELTQISKDHTAPDNANCITSYVGGSGDACFPSLRKGSAEIGSTFLVCTDGVYKFVSEDELKGILRSDLPVPEKERAISKLSLQNGSTDDRSFVLVECAA